MVILGIDPGTRFAGYGVLQKTAGKATLIDYGCLVLPATKHLSERIAIFHDAMQEKITRYNVTDLVLETPFLGKNVQNFLKLGYVRGILYLLAHKNNLKLHEFSPREIKQAVTGYGGASKEQVARVVCQLFPKAKTDVRHDVTDALAVTLCGLWRGTPSLLFR